MNQKRKFAKRTGSGSFLQSVITRLSLNLSLLIVTFVATDNALAQSNFVPTQNSRSESQQWMPPNARPPGVYRASGEQSQSRIPNAISFPQAAFAFEPSVRTANLDVTATSKLDGASSVASTLDSTATMLSDLKDATGEKISGWATTINQNGGWTEGIMSVFGSSDTSKMIGSLTLVLGIYFAFVWVMRKINPTANAGLPPEVVEVMGQIPFGPKRNLQIVRLGSKLLLLMNSPEGTQPIGEITNPNEVQYLASLCPGKRKTGGHSLTAIQNAASRLAITRPSPAPTPAQSPSANSNLANILQTLDRTANNNTAIYEA